LVIGLVCLVWFGLVWFWAWYNKKRSTTRTEEKYNVPSPYLAGSLLGLAGLVGGRLLGLAGCDPARTRTTGQNKERVHVWNDGYMLGV
jgi:hypothetical protein